MITGNKLNLPHKRRGLYLHRNRAWVAPYFIRGCLTITHFPFLVDSNWNRIQLRQPRVKRGLVKATSHGISNPQRTLRPSAELLLLARGQNSSIQPLGRLAVLYPINQASHYILRERTRLVLAGSTVSRARDEEAAHIGAEV
jgi:hypothetical protein